MFFQNVNVVNLHFILRIKMPKFQISDKLYLAILCANYASVKYCIQMSFKNVNVAKFNFILRINLQKLQIFF